MALTLNKDQAPIYRLPMSDMRDEAQCGEELAAAEDVRDAEVGAEELEHGVDAGRGEVRVASADPGSCFTDADLQGGIVGVVVGVGAGCVVLAGQVTQGGGV